MHQVYILQSDATGRLYTGYSGDADQRLAFHNAGRVKATRTQRPWRLVYTEDYETATEARQREAYLKRLKSRRILLDLISRGPLAQSVRAQS